MRRDLDEDAKIFCCFSGRVLNWQKAKENKHSYLRNHTLKMWEKFMSGEVFCPKTWLLACGPYLLWLRFRLNYLSSDMILAWCSGQFNPINLIWSQLSMYQRSYAPVHHTVVSVVTCNRLKHRLLSTIYLGFLVTVSVTFLTFCCQPFPHCR